jgi:hypothetical protein
MNEGDLMSEAEFKPTELSNLLDGQSTESPAAAAPPSPEPPQEPPSETPPPEAVVQPETAGQPRGPDGKFAKKTNETGGDGAAVAAEAAAAPTPENEPGGSPPPDKAPVPQAALIGERRRRQEAEERARFLEQQVQALSRLPQAPPVEQPKVDFWDDPEAALQARFDQFGDQLLTRFEQRQVINHLNRSEVAARARYDDFDEAVSEFQRAVTTNPALAQEMKLADDPAEFAYRKGKSLAELHQYGDLDSLLAAKRAEWEAELLAKAPAPAPTLPPSTATERSVSVPRAGPQWTGPKPLSDLLR